MPAIRILVGLGNPGTRLRAHASQRGFLAGRTLRRARWHYAAQRCANTRRYVGRHAPSGAWLLLPQTYMNASGQVGACFSRGFFKIAPTEILVVHDELDLAPGTAKLKQGGGVAGHNGLRDIAARIGIERFLAPADRHRAPRRPQCGGRLRAQQAHPRTAQRSISRSTARSTCSGQCGSRATCGKRRRC